MVIVKLIVAWCVIGGAQLSTVEPSASSIYSTAIHSSGLLINIQNLTTAADEARTSLDQLPTSWSTLELQENARLVKRFAFKVTNLIIKYGNALTIMASDATDSIEEFSGKVEKASARLSRYARKDYEKYVAEISERIGCPLSDQFEVVWKEINYEINNTATIVASLGKAIDDSHSGSSVTTADLVGELANSVLKLKSTISSFTNTLSASFAGLTSANTFGGQISSNRNGTYTSLNSSRSAIKTAVGAQLSTVLETYHGVLRTIKSDISTNLAKLSVFASNKHLRTFTERFKDAFKQFERFLRGRSRIDSARFKKYFSILKDDSYRITNKAFDMLIDAIQRTSYRAMDVMTERGPSADSCFTTFSGQLTPLYFQLSTLSQQCISRETPRWMTINTVVSDVATLVLTNEIELTTNIARCANFINYETSSRDYSQAEACMKTNLEDLQELAEVIQPQFDLIDKLVREQVEASEYRLENCYFSRLHEMTALLKTMRSSIESCVGKIEECPWKERDDDAHDWFDRGREKYCDEWESDLDKLVSNDIAEDEEDFDGEDNRIEVTAKNRKPVKDQSNEDESDESIEAPLRVNTVLKLVSNARTAIATSTSTTTTTPKPTTTATPEVTTTTNLPEEIEASTTTVVTTQPTTTTLTTTEATTHPTTTTSTTTVTARPRSTNCTGKYEYFSEYGSHCMETCAGLLNPMGCADCEADCYCLFGFVRDSRDNCVNSYMHCKTNSGKPWSVDVMEETVCEKIYGSM